jgi:phage terminase small subunit
MLPNTQHEQFAQALARDVCATKAYTSAGYIQRGARQNASRLMANSDIRARVEELKSAITAV